MFSPSPVSPGVSPAGRVVGGDFFGVFAMKRRRPAKWCPAPAVAPVVPRMLRLEQKTGSGEWVGGCDFRAPAPRCAVMRGRAVALGLPDCAGGYVYREVAWEQV